MKVKIVKCSNKDWWHQDYIGQVVEVDEKDWSWDAYFAPEIKYFGAVLPKRDCIIV